MDEGGLMQPKLTREQPQQDYVSNVTNQDTSHEIVLNDGPKIVPPIGLRLPKFRNGSP